MYMRKTKFYPPQEKPGSDKECLAGGGKGGVSTQAARVGTFSSNDHVAVTGAQS